MTIPSSVESIDEYALANAANLVEIEIDPSVTTIKSYAFAHTSSLGAVALPNTVTVIAECKLLRSIKTCATRRTHGGALALALY